MVGADGVGMGSAAGSHQRDAANSASYCTLSHRRQKRAHDLPTLSSFVNIIDDRLELLDVNINYWKDILHKFAR